MHKIFGRATKGNSLPLGETLTRKVKATSISIIERSAFFVDSKQQSSFFSGVTAPVHTSGSTGLTNLDSREKRQVGLQFCPDPARDIFTGWVFESGNII